MSDTFIFQTELRPDSDTEIPRLAEVYYEAGELKETPLPYSGIRIVEHTEPNDERAYKVVVRVPYQFNEGDVINVHGDWTEGNGNEKQRLDTGYFQVRGKQILPAGSIERGANEQAMHLCVEKYVQKCIQKRIAEEFVNTTPLTVSIVPTNEEGDSE